MGVTARTLEVQNFRSFAAYEVELSPGVTILVGKNAAGKTNLVEALQLLTSGRSFRRPRPYELLREGCAAGRIDLSMEGDGRAIDVSCVLEPEKRTFSRNGKRVRPHELRGELPAILFCPDHLDMVKRSASVRRDAIDEFGTQLNAQYAKLAGSYAKILEQRNNLLKDECCPEDLLAVWDEALVSAGAALMVHRRALTERVRGHFRQVYEQVAPHETADMVYQASIGSGEEQREDLAEAFARALVERRADERRRGITLVGPHRDDILFTIDGRAARDFGSQGQQRTIVLAWKIAEVKVTLDILGQSPLLLLDDVMSELDQGRRESIMAFVEGGIQTVVTTTNLGYFSDAALSAAHVVEVGRG